MSIHTYKPEDIRATFTMPNGEVFRFKPLEGIEPVEFRTLEPMPARSELAYLVGQCKTGDVLIHGSKSYCELYYGHRGRRVVGRKIRQARRRMRRMMEGCL